MAILQTTPSLQSSEKTKTPSLRAQRSNLQQATTTQQTDCRVVPPRNDSVNENAALAHNTVIASTTRKLKHRHYKATRKLKHRHYERSEVISSADLISSKLPLLSKQIAASFLLAMTVLMKMQR